MEMLLTGRSIDAQTALRWGLVNRVVAAAQLDDAVREFTDLILSRSPAVIRIGKQTFYEQIHRPVDAAYDVAGQAMVSNVLYEDAAEGMDAFLEKRPAHWRNR
jgi:enoyl-CoA hydratase/carnithine racemase